MKYKIRIWRYGSIVDSYESNDINEIKKWYMDKWHFVYDYLGACYWEIYKDNKEMNYDELYNLGFYD